MIYGPLDIGMTVYTKTRIENNMKEVVIMATMWQVLASSESRHPDTYVSLLETKVFNPTTRIVQRKYLYSTAQEAIEAQE